MYIIRGLRNLPSRFRGAAVTIGNFDGVHLGHQTIFRHLRQLAAVQNAPTLAITFEPHPGRLLRPTSAPARIIGVRGKARWMEEQGLDGMLILRFTHDMAGWSAERFVTEVLVQGIGVCEVLVGQGFRFGRAGQGNQDTLRAMGQQHGFTAHEEPLFQTDGETISSTRIRAAVQGRNFALAARLLGRPFELEARVGTGFKRGRGLGFPTANMALGDLLHPPAGVYLVEGWVDGAWLPGIANLGNNPTFNDPVPHLETHMLAPCGDLYRRVLRIRFLSYVRDEIRFPDPQALKEQIGRDVQEAEAFFAQRVV